MESQTWSAKHRETVIARLKYIPQSVRAMPLEQISPRLLMEQVLRPLERAEKLETAKRVRIIISQIYRYAIALGDVFTDPARDLQSALKPAVKKPMAAIVTEDDFKELWKAICAYPQKSMRCAMQISALTFQRPFNLRAMEWAELDLEKRVWIIPASKMKMRVTRKETAPPHQVPLSKEALAVIAEIPKVVESPYCFPNQRSVERPMSDAAVGRALQALGYPKEEGVRNFV